MRGNLWAISPRARVSGSIPAHAGKPTDKIICGHILTVYPRACGETAGGVLDRGRPGGLSPRMRGNLIQFDLATAGDGSIPAHAGKPNQPRCAHKPLRVYPRACGETLGERVIANFKGGLSPRMRGNPSAYIYRGLPLGSIPAHAGKPITCGFFCARPGVYPRACGETLRRARLSAPVWGLSPRMRGNRQRR